MDTRRPLVGFKETSKMTTHLPTNLMKYPAYKDSGVEWIGVIPKQWNVARIKYLARFKYGDSLSSDLRIAGDIPVYGSNGQVGNHSLANTHAPCVIIGRKGSYGKINYSALNCFAIDTTFYIDDTSTKCYIRWLYYCLSIIGLDTTSQDSAVPGLSRDYAHNLWLPKIPLPEQRAIADFLDRETARIDTLIAKYQRLMELLEEKRASLISEAVTKGLDKSVTMKDSGVEWLGKIPEHWRIFTLKNIALLVNRGNSPDYVHDSYVKVINQACIHWYGLNLENVKYQNEKEVEIQRWKGFLQSGDLLVNSTGTGTLGRASLFFEDGTFIADSHVTIIRVNPKFVNRRYLYYLIRTSLYQGYIYSAIVTGSTNQIELSRDGLRNTPIIIPLLDEQFIIADFLDRETGRIDSVNEKIKRMISKLQEYRVTLISSAVTGKIDVRN
jgi:type I restriction enzyme, S subunit